MYRRWWLIGIGALLVFACTLIPGPGQAPNAADEAVLALFSEEPGLPTVVFRYPEVLKPGDSVSSFVDDEEDGRVSVIHTAEEDTYFYFVDYFDGYFYAHPVDYIFVTTDGEVSRIVGEWWPMVNGEAVFFTAQDRANRANILAEFPADWELSEQVGETRGSGTHTLASRTGPLFVGASTMDNSTSAADGGGTAVVVNGVAKSDAVRPQAEEAARQAVGALRGSGRYERVESFDAGEGEANCETRDRLDDWLKDFDATPGTNLTLVFVSHGSTRGSLRVGDCGMHRRRLASRVQELNEKGIRVKVVLEACYSGSLITGLMGFKDDFRVALTSSDDEPSCADDLDKVTDRDGNTRSDTNPDDTGPEFMSGLWEDYEEINRRLKDEDNEELREWFAALVAGANADGADVREEELILYAASQTALEKDLTAQVGFTTATGRFIRAEPQRFPESFPGPGLQEDEGENGIPDWIEILIGRRSVPPVPTSTPTPTPTPTSTSTPTPTSTSTSTPTFTPTLTPTSTPSATATPPSMAPAARILLANQCGTPLYFAIAGTTYEVPANSEVWIEVPAGEHDITIRMDGRQDHNDTWHLEAGVTYGQQIQCCQDDTLGTDNKRCTGG